MNNIVIWTILGVVSVIFGIFSRIAAHHNKSKPWWFFEWWRDFVNYFITTAIGYFFISVRYPKITESGNLSTSDFFLLVAFLVGALGWWPYFIKNVTEGINTILSKVLDKK